ncbi:class I SAM-dependent methyltransferase [Oricola sp.]|uniref:class I SAM-dependent methyltransferase n=1 Tax=Oricola sp. TaxID=1979950 RepID=UPI003BAC074F
MPTASFKASFWDRLARKYAAQPIADAAAYEKTLQRTRAWLKPEDTVLELGCGTGSTAILHAPHVHHITGSDISPEMITIANEKLDTGGPANADFIAATPDDTRFQAGAYDVVLTFNFLHLVEDLPATLQRIHTLLKPGGLLIAKTPCVGDMGIMPRLAVPVMRAFGRAPFVNFFSKDRFAAAVAEAGFTVEESGLHAATGHSLFVVGQRG